MKSRLPLALLLAATLSLGSLRPSTTVADDTAPPSPDAPKTAEPVDDAQVATWLKGLESDSFAERQAATNGLVRAGAGAVEAIAKTAEESFDLEVPTRCVNILGKMLKSDDEATQKAARAALEGLTKSDRKFVANRAAETIKGPEQPAVVNPFGGGGARIVINGVVGGAGGMRISQSTVNGVRTTDVEADGKKIKVVDTNGKDISMKVTETVAGKEVTKEYAGKDLADLKQKHPEGAKLYEQYVEGKGNGIGVFRGVQRIQIAPGGRIQIAPGQAIPALPVIPNVKPFKMPLVPREKVDEAIEQLEKSLESIKAIEQRGDVSAKSLEEIRKQVDEARRTLEGIE